MIPCGPCTATRSNSDTPGTAAIPGVSNGGHGPARGEGARASSFRGTFRHHWLPGIAEGVRHGACHRSHQRAERSDEAQRPAPWLPVGHPAITAGTIGARVRDAPWPRLHPRTTTSSRIPMAPHRRSRHQPGPFDGGTSADQIATLSDFQVISFSGASNTATGIARRVPSGNAVPSDDGYGMPNSAIYGDANGDGVFDDRNALLGLNVQKYGRTTRLTHGQIAGVNATVTVCYEASDFVCTKSARYVDQLIITPAGFSNGGDSGSLIVTDDANLNPVGLLFAGSATVTIANRIDLVLNRFGSHRRLRPAASRSVHRCGGAERQRPRRGRAEQTVQHLRVRQERRQPGRGRLQCYAGGYDRACDRGDPERRRPGGGCRDDGHVYVDSRDRRQSRSRRAPNVERRPGGEQSGLARFRRGAPDRWP